MAGKEKRKEAVDSNAVDARNNAAAKPGRPFETSLPFVQIEPQMLRHHKVTKFVEQLGPDSDLPRHQWYLLRPLPLNLILHCGLCAVDGVLGGEVSAAHIAMIVGWHGDPEKLLRAFIDSGFIDVREGVMHLHDWYDYSGKAVRDRERWRTNKARERSRRAPEFRDTVNSEFRDTVNSEFRDTVNRVSDSAGALSDSPEKITETRNGNSDEQLSSGHLRLRGRGRRREIKRSAKNNFVTGETPDKEEESSARKKGRGRPPSPATAPHRAVLHRAWGPCDDDDIRQTVAHLLRGMPVEVCERAVAAAAKHGAPHWAYGVWCLRTQRQIHRARLEREKERETRIEQEQATQCPQLTEQERNASEAAMHEAVKALFGGAVRARAGAQPAQGVGSVPDNGRAPSAAHGPTSQ